MTNAQGRLTLAATAATLMATLTLVPLVQGGTWFVVTFLVVVVVAGVGAAARQLLRSPVLVVLAQVMALGLTLTWLFAREVAAWGLLPGPDVVTALNDLLNAGLTVTRQETPPVPAIRGVILVIAGGIGLIALVVDMIAATLQRPAVAGLPLLAVYCVPAAVLPGGLPWWYFVIAALGFLVLVGSDSADRIRSWGRVLGPAGESAGDSALGGPLAGARRLAVGCVLLSAAVPVLVPGLGDKLLGQGDNGNGPGHGGAIKVLNPILHLREDLTQRGDAVVIRYRTNTTQPEPLRVVSDEEFDGETWSPAVGEVPRDNKVQDGLPSPPGLGAAVDTRKLTTQITTFDLGETYLPLPYPTSRVNVPGTWLYDSSNLNVVGDGVVSRNLNYTVEHLLVQPTPEQLQTATGPPVSVQARYTKLPAKLPKVIADTARTVAGDGSPYEQAVKIQNWLRGNSFQYSEQLTSSDSRRDSGEDAIVAFLKNRRGYCVQFASTMAVMARTLGIPSRVAVGFQPGRPVANGMYEITIKDAHAWPELFFSGVGWVRFEPTPARHVGDAPSWAQSPAAQAPAPAATPSVTAAPRPSQAAPQRERQPDAAPVQHQPPLLDRILDAVPWRWLAGLVVLLLLGFVPLAVEHLVREARWRRASRGGPVERVEAAWDELRERLDDLGVAWAASWTPRALQLRLIGDHNLPGSAQAALGRLVGDLEHVEYARPDGASREITALRADVGEVVQAVAASERITPWTRRRARWLPASGLRVIGTAARRVDAAADAAGRRVSQVGTDVRRRVSRR